MIRTNQQQSQRCSALATQVRRMVALLAVALLLSSPFRLEAEDWATGALTWTCAGIEAIKNRSMLEGIQAAVTAAISSASKAEEEARTRYDAVQRAEKRALEDWNANEAQIRQKVQTADADKNRYQSEIGEKLPQWQRLRDEINIKTQELAETEEKLKGGVGRIGGASALQLTAQLEAERDKLRKEIGEKAAQKQELEARILELQGWIKNVEQQLVNEVTPLIENGRQLLARLEDARQALQAAKQKYDDAQAFAAKVNAAGIGLQDCIRTALQTLDKEPSQRGDAGGYDPTKDPGMGLGSPVTPGAMQSGQEFQGGAPWGSGQQPPSGPTQPGQPQPPSYTGTEPQPGTTGPQPPPWYPPYPPYPCGYSGYPPCPPGYGGPPVQVPWGGLVPGGTPPMGGGGECPPGCHMRPDGSGCHCPRGGGSP